MINLQKSVFEVGSATRNINYMFLSVLETRFFLRRYRKFIMGHAFKKVVEELRDFVKRDY